MSSKVITNEQLMNILDKYSLGKLSSSLNRLTNGWSNITMKFSVEPNDRQLIVRQYLSGRLRSINRETIQSELNLIKFLFEELNLPVVSMLDPPGLLTINDVDYVVLFPFVNGMKYLDTATNSVRQLWQTIEISRFLGRMHSNLKTNQYKVDKNSRSTINYLDIKYKLMTSCDSFSHEYPDLYQRIVKIINEHTKSIPLTSDKSEQIRLENEIEKNLPIGYIHADLHDDNVLFDPKEKKIVAVLDFDDMYVAPLIIDISMSICCWCSIGAKFKIDLARAFLFNYEQERGILLTDNEWNLLEVYCYLTTLNQVLFTIEAEKDVQSTRETINDLLLPIECIGQEEQFLEKIR